MSASGPEARGPGRRDPEAPTKPSEVGRWPSLRRPNPVFSDEYRAMVQVLIAARRRAGLSQRTLADRLSKSPSHVARIEAGDRRVDLLEAFRIAEALGVHPEPFFAELARVVRLAGDRQTHPSRRIDESPRA